MRKFHFLLPNKWEFTEYPCTVSKLHHFSSPNDAIALNKPNTSTPSFMPSPAVRAVPVSSFATRRLSSSAATKPVTAPMNAPNIKVLLLFMGYFPFILLSAASSPPRTAAGATRVRKLFPSKDCLDARPKPLDLQHRFHDRVGSAFNIAFGFINIILRQAGVGRCDVEQFHH